MVKCTHKKCLIVRVCACISYKCFKVRNVVYFLNGVTTAIKAKISLKCGIRHFQGLNTMSTKT